MPELPEVEVSRLGITPHLTNRTIRRIDVRQPMLRWPVPAEVMNVTNAPVLNVSRRAKYLLIEVPGGSIILHLGMSGNLKILSADTPAGKHDHVDIVLDNRTLLRLNDTRRFGAVLWQVYRDGTSIIDYFRARTAYAGVSRGSSCSRSAKNAVAPSNWC